MHGDSGSSRSSQQAIIAANFVDPVVIALAAAQYLKQQEAEAVLQMWERRVATAAVGNQALLEDLENAQYTNFVVDDYAASKLPEVRFLRVEVPECVAVLSLPVLSVCCVLACVRACVCVACCFFKAQRGEGSDHVIKMLQNQGRVLADLSSAYTESIEELLKIRNGDSLD